MANTLKFFMREELKKDLIVEIPGVATFADENGNPVPFKIRALGSEELSDIRESCRIRRMVKDSKGKPLFINGQVQYVDDYDQNLVNDTMIAFALVDPDLHDKQLLDYYGVQEASKLVRKMFKKIDDYQYISQKVAEVSGIDTEAQEVIDEIKN